MITKEVGGSGRRNFFSTAITCPGLSPDLGNKVFLDVFAVPKKTDDDRMSGEEILTIDLKFPNADKGNPPTVISPEDFGTVVNGLEDTSPTLKADELEIFRDTFHALENVVASGQLSKHQTGLPLQTLKLIPSKEVTTLGIRIERIIGAHQLTVAGISVGMPYEAARKLLDPDDPKMPLGETEFEPHDERLQVESSVYQLERRVASLHEKHVKQWSVSHAVTVLGEGDPSQNHNALVKALVASAGGINDPSEIQKSQRLQDLFNTVNTTLRVLDGRFHDEHLENPELMSILERVSVRRRLLESP